MRVKVTFKKSYNGNSVSYTKEVSAGIAEKQLALPEKDRNPAWRGAVFADEVTEATPVAPKIEATPVASVRRRQRTETAPVESEEPQLGKEDLNESI